MNIQIELDSKQTLYAQILSQIRLLIENGTMPEGFRLPSSRQLAVHLGINRSTVIRVYDELWALGYIESTPGSYTRVRRRKPVTGPAGGSAAADSSGSRLYSGGPPCDITMMDRYAQLMTEADAGIIDFYHLVPDPRLPDPGAMRECFQVALKNEGNHLYCYQNPRGYPPLREAILNHMRLHSVHADDAQILITNGSQHSLSLIFQAFSSRGDVIGIESPTYAMLFPLIRYFGLEVAEVPGGSEGIDVEGIEKLLKERQLKFIYTTPTFHNPTGGTLSQEKREKLLGLCEQFAVILIEDSIEEEMKYFGKTHLPVKSMDQQGHVIYLGSFSKILSPGFRTGWVIAPENCIRRMTAVKTMTDLSSNSLVQVMLYHYLARGHYELHLRRMMRVFRKRMTVALESLRKYIPGHLAEWNEPLGGFLIWLRIKAAVPGDPEAWFLRYGVRITDGRIFYCGAPPEGAVPVRISISKCNAAEIVTGIRRMGEAIAGLPQ